MASTHSTGLLTALDTTAQHSRSHSATPGRLTWKGYEFIEAARSPKRWKAVMKSVEKVSGVTIQVLTALLIADMKKNLGLA